MERPVAGFMAQAACFVDKEFRWIAFVDENDVDDENGALDYACEIFRPAPSESRVGNESCGYNRA